MSQHLKIVSYIIEKRDSTYLARDKYGKIFSKSDIFKTVIDDVISEISYVGGGKIFITKSVIASYSGKIYITSSNIEMEGEKGHQLTHTGTNFAFHIQGTLDNYIDNIRLKDINLKCSNGSEEDGFTFVYVENSIIENCSLRDSHEEGIILYDCRNVKIIKNNLDNCGQDVTNPSIEIKDTATGADVRNNYIGYNKIINSPKIAITVRGTKNTVIENNIITNSSITTADKIGSAGIVIWAGGETSETDVDDVIIRENMIDTPYAYGILINSGGTNSNNHINILNNTIINGKYFGIGVFGDSTRVGIDHNTIKNCIYGAIQVQNKPRYGRIHGNFCIDSPVSFTTTNIITLYDNVTDWIIDGNTLIFKNSGQGQHLISIQNQCNRNNILNNYLYRPDLNNRGIVISSNCDDNMIQNNRILNSWSCVQIWSADCQNTLIQGNYFNRGSLSIGESGNISTVIKNNYSFNPIGKISNPFENIYNTISWSKGNQSSPTADTTYIIKQIDMIITSYGGSNVDITVYDLNDNIITENELELSALYLPVGYKINWGSFTSDPTVIIGGN